MKNYYNIVFPGQGSQRPGMGADFFERYPESREVFDRASEALKFNVADLCFTENEKLDLTEYTQPCILTCSIAMYEVIRVRTTITPGLYAGHSLGEYAALVAAGVVPLEAAVKIVKKRGELMQRAVPAGEGAMAALTGNLVHAEALYSIVNRCGAEIANLNSSDQVVITGKTAAVDNALTVVKGEIPGVHGMRLNVSAPFHSSLMRSIELEFAEFLDTFAWTFTLENAQRVLSNLSGVRHRPETLLADLVHQISGPVRWIDNMHELQRTGFPTIEVGPGKPLGRFLATHGIAANSIMNLRSFKNFTDTYHGGEHIAG